MTSIPRRFASAWTSSITGSAPWAPVPTMSRLPPQGISSSGRKRRVAELFAELLGRSFLPFPHFAAVHHHITRIALSLDLDLAKFDQSRFHISIRIGALSRMTFAKLPDHAPESVGFSALHYLERR